MPSVIKTVSLDVTTAEQASNMDNFSLYIRECLSGTLHIKYEAAKRLNIELLKLIKRAVEMGSQDPSFQEQAEIQLSQVIL